jgi:hypothetical protein
MARSRDSQVSILGSSYFEPIADLLDRWLSRPSHKPNAVQSGYYEHGYAASVILLLVAMLESYVVRVRYIQRPVVPVKLRTAIDVLLYLYPRLRHRKALTDVYVARDAIFHNHLWEIEYSWGRSPSMILHGAVKDPAFGDTKYSVRVNPNTRRTKALGISVVPTRVDRRDVKKVFQTVWKTLLFLEHRNRNQCYVSHLHVRFRGKSVLFGDLIQYL